MSRFKQSRQFKIYNKSCYGLHELPDNSVDAVVTDPPYGISFQNHKWDKHLPRAEIWRDSLRVLKPGGFGLVFSSIRLMHRVAVDLEEAGFVVRDVLMWASLNGMPKSRNVAVDIDRELGIQSKVQGFYRYQQGYRNGGADTYTHDQKRPRLEPASELGLRFKGAGLALKPAYEPIILVQKPLESGLTAAQNVIRFGTGALNLEQSRIPYAPGEDGVGHNPHPNGRTPANILRTDSLGDGYDKFFLVPKVRQDKDEFNTHPTVKPVELMAHLVKLVSFADQTVLDPFMGTGSTGIAAMLFERNFVGYEIDERYFDIAVRRLQDAKQVCPTLHKSQSNEMTANPHQSLPFRKAAAS